MINRFSKTALAGGAAMYLFAAPCAAGEMPTYGAGEINGDFREYGIDAEQKYNKWFLLSGMVQAVKKDSWNLAWIQIRDPDDK
jgi:hypothetical protein